MGHVPHPLGYPAAAVALALALSGCTAAGPAPEPSASSDTDASVSLQESCEQFGDVLTILHNARASFQDGRSSEQELDGASRLAARILDRVDVEPGTDIAEAIAAAQEIAPGAPIGAMRKTLDPESAEWELARTAIGDACNAGGAELPASAWTGG